MRLAAHTLASAALYTLALTLTPHPANLILAALLAGVASAPSPKPWLSAGLGGLSAYTLLALATGTLPSSALLLAGVLGPLSIVALIYHFIAPALAGEALAEAWKAASKLVRPR
ncbi:MAG: hypothetical protein F7B17_07645 [Desulfurococcales archaeon]|nr:hypothetical protein [Desulfurococcales archaeon]